MGKSKALYILVVFICIFLFGCNSNTPNATQSSPSQNSIDKTKISNWLDKYSKNMVKVIGADTFGEWETDTENAMENLKGIVSNSGSLWNQLKEYVGVWNGAGTAQPLIKNVKIDSFDFVESQSYPGCIEITTKETWTEVTNANGTESFVINNKYILNYDGQSMICMDADLKEFQEMLNNPDLYKNDTYGDAGEELEEEYWALVDFQASTPKPRFSLVSNSFEVQNSLYGSDVMAALKSSQLHENYEAGEHVKLEFNYYLSGNLRGSSNVEGIVTSKTDYSMTISATYAIAQSSPVNIQLVYERQYY